MILDLKIREGMPGYKQQEYRKQNKVLLDQRDRLLAALRDVINGDHGARCDANETLIAIEMEIED